MIFTITQIGVEIGNILQRFFNPQLFLNTVRTQRNREVRIVIHHLTIAIDWLFNARSVGHFQRVIQTLDLNITLVSQANAIEIQLLLLKARF